MIILGILFFKYGDLLALDRDLLLSLLEYIGHDRGRFFLLLVVKGLLEDVIHRVLFMSLLEDLAHGICRV